MRRVLITGENSYIGGAVEKYLKEYRGKYVVDTIDVKADKWRNTSFRGYDVIFHVAGIAHVSTKKSLEEDYYKVNTELAYAIGEKAKNEQVKQFVFMSSMIVYSSKNEIIGKQTKPAPDNFYGDSKLKADMKLHAIEDEHFIVASIRPPMVYGPNSKGNFPKLVKIARLLPVVPEYKNARSMIYIENLCACIEAVIDSGKGGIFFPQNEQYVCTTDLLRTIRTVCGKRTKSTKLFNPLIKAGVKYSRIVRKVFGNYAYEKELTADFAYNKVGFEESVRRAI